MSNILHRLNRSSFKLNFSTYTKIKVLILLMSKWGCLWSGVASLFVTYQVPKLLQRHVFLVVGFLSHQHPAG